MRSVRLGTLVTVLSAGLLIAGCGSGSTHGRPGAARSTDVAAVTVIRSWSNALRGGDVKAAARYFALPSEFANGLEVGGVMAISAIRTEAEAVEINSGLSCGSRLISTSREGRYISALFRLTNRRGPGGGCGTGVGALARADFLITGGRIVEWIRAPVSGGGIPHVPAVPAPTPSVGLV